MSDTQEAPASPAPTKAWRNMTGLERKAEQERRRLVSGSTAEVTLTAATAAPESVRAEIAAKDAQIAALMAQIAAAPPRPDISKLPKFEAVYEFTYARRDPESDALVGGKIALGDPEWDKFLAEPRLVSWGSAVFNELRYGPNGDVIARIERASYREKSPQAAHARLMLYASKGEWFERTAAPQAVPA